MNNEELKKIFEEAGKKYGFDEVNAEFTAYHDFKVRWQRSYKWADFRVSDYLDDMDSETLDLLAHSLFERIIGEEDTHYLEFRKKVATDEFALNHQEKYISRCFAIGRDYPRSQKRIDDALEILYNDGRMPRDSIYKAFWTDDKEASSSVLFRTIAIPVSMYLKDPEEIAEVIAEKYGLAVKGLEEYQ